MKHDRYQSAFANLGQLNEGAFVPFTVLGDPDPATSLGILRAFAKGGADMLELGIPFSDPVADGPTIQAAGKRAMAAGTTPAVALSILARFRAEYPKLPIGLLVYANLALRAGLDHFYSRAARAGCDSVLVADLPPEEAAPFRHEAALAGVGHVAMATPLSSDDRLRQAVNATGPYLYVVSRTGVTGQDSSLSRSAGPLISRIRRLGKVPQLLGFGIGKPEHVSEALSAGATGAISGSAAVEIIARHAENRSAMTESSRNRLERELCVFTQAMKEATR